ncbi:hypothetical protein [Cryptosporangium phraense]|uniref:Uncharacterized protein n=1 Tax=Cryptosporangium phraense TaxID=2593070 RepID=A0A545ARV6_9ACTN|nr:hypothetical protein [Cryptosporangium phraense]TQS44070.1 hypothetical protein FL583_16605 [Cryptosporangium phraense]
MTRVITIVIGLVVAGVVAYSLIGIIVESVDPSAPSCGSEQPCPNPSIDDGAGSWNPDDRNQDDRERGPVDRVPERGRP